MIRVNTMLSRNPILLFTISLVIPLTGTALIGIILLNLPDTDMQRLLTFMTGTGIVTTLFSYGFYKLGILQWFSSLRWSVMAIITLIVSMIFLNVWVIAQFTFIDNHYLTLTTILLVFAALTAVTLGFFASKTMTDRLSYLTLGTQQLAQGDLGTRLTVQGNDEIAQLTNTFNDMAHSLQEVDQQKRLLEKTRRDLIAWVSHDLRTPLASMRVMIEAMSDGVVTDEETVTRYLDNSRAEIEHLSRLIDDLFEMAQLDVGHLPMTFQHASLRDLISDTLGSMMLKARQKGVLLEGKIADDIDMIDMATDKIQRVLFNLLDNAIKYTPKDETITLNAQQSGQMLQINIHNSGTQIPEEVLPHLFESFYRGEQSRAISDDGMRGTGLGLAIARGFVQAHGGHIWAESHQEKGTTFSFTIPRRQTHP